MEHYEAVRTLTQELLEKLGFQVEVTVKDVEGMCYVHVQTEDSPSLLIGKHARMLASLQRVLMAMSFKKTGERVDVLLDVNDYRDVQKQRLASIADNLAQRVLEDGRPARLSSFSAYERKLIHEHVSLNYLTLNSHSEGEGRNRVLIIERNPS